MSNIMSDWANLRYRIYDLRAVGAVDAYGPFSNGFVRSMVLRVADPRSGDGTVRAALASFPVWVN
jgi:hypothetical protein